jgi:hypothetical protein
MVEEICSAMVGSEMTDRRSDAGTGILAGVAELICAAKAPADKPAKATTAIKTIENDLIVYPRPAVHARLQLKTDS